MKCIQGFDVNRWPLPPGCFDTCELDRIGGKDTDIEIRPEEGCEEHDFREDEPTHTHTEGSIHLRAIEPLAAFADHIAEPAKEHPGQHTQTYQQDHNGHTGAVAGAQGIEQLASNNARQIAST